ncbi:MAG TPA: hypothetical protein VF773_22120 [Verrucomicrobiae bacterium]
MAKPGIPMQEKRRFVLEEAETKGNSETKATKREATRERAVERKVKTRSFSATVVLTAVQKVKISVEAESSGAAQKALRAEAARMEMDLAEAKITREIKKG